MSHYAVAVIHRENQTIEELLAPYSENLEVEPYIWKTREEAIKCGKKYFDENLTDDEYIKLVADGNKVDEDGNIYTTYNPKSKWDWYCIGGRFGGTLKSKVDNMHYNSLRIGDIDIAPNFDDYADAIEFWEKYIDGMSEEDEEYNLFFKQSYYKNRYHDKYTYANAETSFSTYSVVTPDGEWHAPGDMGWFGCSSESDEDYIDWVSRYRERFINGNEDLYMTIVDCHI